MLAVVAVILDHLLAWPSGGFVGVDVFFVISGFLITGILIREHEKTNHISFVGFYRRRIKRIVPAATLTLIITVIAGFFLFNSLRSAETFWDAVYAFFFSANWHFAAVGTDYFQANGPVSPLQHFWSLSVEEQFYFVWPWLMLGVLALAALRKGFTRRRTITGIVMVLIVAASFAWALIQTSTNPTVAYFSTFTRAWELGFGALIAIASPWWSKIPAKLRPVLGWIGFLAILVSYFVINNALPFPAPWAALPVVATALVIVAGTGGEQKYLWPLTNPVSFYVGNISYSLYLWHFPIIIFAGVIIGNNPWAFYPITVVAIVAISVSAYHLLEEPLQHSPWLSAHVEGKRSKSALWSQWRTKYGRRLGFGWLGVLSAMCVGLVALALVANPVPATPAQANAFVVTGTPTPGTASQLAAGADGLLPAAALAHAAVEQAVTATGFPSLDPAVDSLGIAGWTVQMKENGGCVDVQIEDADSCVFGPNDPSKVAVVFGDSYAMAWMPGIRAGLVSDGWTIYQLTLGQCPSIDADVYKNGNESFDDCPTWRDAAVAKIAEIKPQLTILASSDTTGTRLVSKATGTGMQKEIQDGTVSLLQKVIPLSQRTLVLGAPPRGVNLQTCDVVGSVPSDCSTRVAEPWVSFEAGQKAAAEAAGVQYISTRLWFCSDAGWCPGFTGSTPIRTDGGHLTVEYSTLLAPVLTEALLTAPAASDSQ